MTLNYRHKTNEKSTLKTDKVPAGVGCTRTTPAPVYFPPASPGQIQIPVESTAGIDQGGPHSVNCGREWCPKCGSTGGGSSAPAPYKERIAKGYNLLASTHAHYINEGEKDPVTDPLKMCGTLAARADCDHGHSYAMRVYCGREWCPICGKKDSPFHKRRYARLIPKMQTMATMGYLVIEWKLAHRDDLASAAALREKRTAIKRYLKRQGYDRGYARWHFYGDKHPGRYNPHLNILIPTGHIAMPELEALKRGLARLLGVDMVIVNYRYSSKPKMMLHWIKYVTRATFTNHEWNRELALDLYRFNVGVTWGKWDGLPVMWEMRGDREIQKLIALEKGECPECGGKIHWCRHQYVDMDTGEITEGEIRLFSTAYLENCGYEEYKPGWLHAERAPRPADEYRYYHSEPPENKQSMVAWRKSMSRARALISLDWTPEPPVDPQMRFGDVN